MTWQDVGMSVVGAFAAKYGEAAATEVFGSEAVATAAAAVPFAGWVVAAGFGVYEGAEALNEYINGKPDPQKFANLVRDWIDARGRSNVPASILAIAELDTYPDTRKIDPAAQAAASAAGAKVAAWLNALPPPMPTTGRTSFDVASFVRAPSTSGRLGFDLAGQIKSNATPDGQSISPIIAERNANQAKARLYTAGIIVCLMGAYIWDKKRGYGWKR